MVYRRGTSATKKRLIVGGAVILVLAGILTMLELTNATHLFHKQVHYISTPTRGGGSVNQQKGEPQKLSSTSASSSATTQAGSDKSAAASATAVLTTPAGDFVSNHNPSLSSAPTESSVCNTTSGATCTIAFTKDGVTKQLEVRMTDSTGAAYWDWNLQAAGLTAGSWQIKAVAQLGGQTKSSSDAMNLEVAQ